MLQSVTGDFHIGCHCFTNTWFSATFEGAPPLNIIFMPGRYFFWEVYCRPSSNSLLGLAFDETYSRLGHGRGYYDRFLNDYWSLCDQRNWPKPYLSTSLVKIYNTSQEFITVFLVALGLREQILPPGRIPTASHDFKPDMIITPEGILPQKPDLDSWTKAISSWINWVPK